MSTLSSGFLSPASGSRTGHGFQPMMSVLASVVAEWRARQAVRRVESLSDEVLHDIGITRGEIDQAVRVGRTSRA